MPELQIPNKQMNQPGGVQPMGMKPAMPAGPQPMVNPGMGGQPGMPPVGTPAPVPAAAPAPMSAPAPTPMPGTPMPAAKQSLPTDSFGQVIKPEDNQLKPAEASVPQFNNGMLTMPPKPAEPEAKEAAKKEKKASLFAKKADKDNGTEKPMPALVTTIIVVLVIVLAGIAMFLLWNEQHRQVVTLNQAVSDCNAANQRLSSEMAAVQEEIARNDLPVYVDPAGHFSFFQNVPNMQVTGDEDNGVIVTYGQVNGDEITDGFVMSIEAKTVGANGLGAIVDNDFDNPKEGVENTDKRSENFADHLGYSYVSNNGEEEIIYYYLQNQVGSNNYVKIAYQIATSSQAKYENYEQVVVNLMRSLKIY
ncbi:hypothetical protein IJI99_02970 [bacterium]|nr:hypothetical protein [bacterium]